MHERLLDEQQSFIHLKHPLGGLIECRDLETKRTFHEIRNQGGEACINGVMMMHVMS